MHCLAHGVAVNAGDARFGNTALLIACDAHADNTSLDSDGDEADEPQGASAERSSENARIKQRPSWANASHVPLGGDDDDDALELSAARATHVPPPPQQSLHPVATRRRCAALAPPPIDVDFVRLVLGARACDVNAPNRAGTTPLMACVAAGAARMPLVELLCAQQPPPRLDVQNRAGCTALHLAALVGNESGVRRLLAMRPPPCVSMCDASGATAAQLAATDAIRVLIDDEAARQQRADACAMC